MSEEISTEAVENEGTLENWLAAKTEVLTDTNPDLTFRQLRKKLAHALHDEQGIWLHPDAHNLAWGYLRRIKYTSQRRQNVSKRVAAGAVLLALIGIAILGFYRYR